MNLDRRISNLETRAGDAPIPATIVATMTPEQAASAYADTLRWAGAASARVAPSDALTPEQAADRYAQLIRDTTTPR